VIETEKKCRTMPLRFSFASNLVVKIGVDLSDKNGYKELSEG
jgi:hypothetical protein